jgi:GNAT superfamily N-acetyltransferase
MDVRIVDVGDAPAFAMLPPCADPAFDHRTCDYWEDSTGGSRAARLSWLAAPAAPPRPPARGPFNPFLDEAGSLDRPAFNPFATGDETGPAVDPFAAPPDNPFAPAPRRAAGPDQDAPRKLALLQRGRGVFGSYAKVLLIGDTPAAYAQFGPLSAYPRARVLRDLYPQLPSAPPPAIITCIATTADARGHGLARLLVDDVCADLAGRGFAVVEAYPERGTALDRTSGGTVELWLSAGFELAVDDERFPVVRRILA